MQRQSSNGNPASAARENRVRIIGGRWRGRKLTFPHVEGLRPTGDRIRETLFNWLAPVLRGARCVDLFAGSGALGFEALSRGAACCVMVERNPAAVRCLRAAQQLLAVGDIASIVAVDAQDWIATASGTFEIVFLDPPFADLSLSPAMLVEQMQGRGLLAADVSIYVEQASDKPQVIAAGFVAHRSQPAGQVRYSLWRREEIIL